MKKDTAKILKAAKGTANKAKLAKAKGGQSKHKKIIA